MNSFCLPLIVIIALIGVILIYICKLRDKSDITPDIKQDAETGEIDDLFNNRNNPFIGGMCAISFIAILMLVLSGVTHRKYNTQQEISIQKEHQKKLYRDSIQNNKDSIQNKQIELVSSELSDINKTIRETNRIIRRVEQQIKDIKEK